MFGKTNNFHTHHHLDSARERTLKQTKEKKDLRFSRPNHRVSPQAVVLWKIRKETLLDLTRFRSVSTVSTWSRTLNVGKWNPPKGGAWFTLVSLMGNVKV